LLAIFLTSALFAFPGASAAAEPPIDLLPPPRALVTTAPAPPPAYLRRNRYDVWQNYAVDNRGYFQPLVVESPNGPVFRYNNAPAPWVTVNPRSYQRIYVGQ
jgi:hypothetical protein